MIYDGLTIVTNPTHCEYGTVIGYELRGVRLKCGDLRLNKFDCIFKKKEIVGNRKH